MSTATALDTRGAGGRGSTANVLAAICSFFLPGLGQLLQGRLFLALLLFCADVVLWFFWLGWLMHIYACFNAAVYRR